MSKERAEKLEALAQDTAAKTGIPVEQARENFQKILKNKENGRIPGKAQQQRNEDAIHHEIAKRDTDPMIFAALEAGVKEFGWKQVWTDKFAQQALRMDRKTKAHIKGFLREMERRNTL